MSVNKHKNTTFGEETNETYGKIAEYDQEEARGEYIERLLF